MICKKCGQKIEYNQFVERRGDFYHPSCWEILRVQRLAELRKKREAAKKQEGDEE